MTAHTQAKIAEALRVAAMTPGQLCELLDYSPETVGRDLSQLRAAGLVGVARNGRRYLTPLGALRVGRWIVEGVEDTRPGGVALARRQGASWADVGEALGITRQAAHKAYANDIAAAEAMYGEGVGA